MWAILKLLGPDYNIFFVHEKANHSQLWVVYRVNILLDSYGS
jgi:hypothetical protein